MRRRTCSPFFFFNDTATTEIYTLSLHDALPIYIQEFRDALTINHSLGELYKLQARNKITPRRAAVMAYTCNLLLRTLPAIYAEEGAAQDDGPMVIPDLPRPAYEESSGPSSQTPDTEASQPLFRT